MKRLVVLLGLLGLLVFAGSASADSTVNIGRNCSVTAYTPTYSNGVITYEGSNDCSNWPTRKQMTVCLQVWFGTYGNVPGTCKSVDITGTGGIDSGYQYSTWGSGSWRTAVIVTDSDRGGGTWVVTGGTVAGTLTT